MNKNALTSMLESKWLYSALLYGYGLFFVGFFLLPKELENYHQGFFYMGLALVGLLVVPKGFQQLRNNVVFWLLCAYLMYMVASVLWGSGDLDAETIKRGFKLLQRALYIVVFFLMIAAIRARAPTAFDQMLKMVAIAAGVSSVITLLLWYSHNPFPESRVWGFSLVRWTIFAAYAYGVFAVISVYGMLNTTEHWLRLALAGAFTALLGYVWLAQSRTAFGATVIGVIVVSMGSKFRHAALVLLLGIAVLLVTTLLFVPDAGELLFSRGLSYRPQIWSAYLERAMNALIIGEGYFSDPRTFVYAPPMIGLVPDAHSGYFGTLRDGGLIGLGLLLATFAAALFRGIQSAWRGAGYLSLALGFEFMAFLMTDTDRLISRTGGQWLFVWLPLAIIVSDPQLVRRRETKPTAADSPG